MEACDVVVACSNMLRVRIYPCFDINNSQCTPGSSAVASCSSLHDVSVSPRRGRCKHKAYFLCCLSGIFANDSADTSGLNGGAREKAIYDYSNTTDDTEEYSSASQDDDGSEQDDYIDDDDNNRDEE
eukprot:20687-Heterococcus_DN1.PRE.3